MKTYFTPEIDKYFAAWILKSTWHSGHSTDCEHFHMFVKALDHYKYETRLDEVMLREKILAAVQRNHDFDRDAAAEIIRSDVRDARAILDFLNDTRTFPDPQVEAWEPPLK